MQRNAYRAKSDGGRNRGRSRETEQAWYSKNKARGNNKKGAAEDDQGESKKKPKKKQDQESKLDITIHREPKRQGTEA